MPGKRIKKHQDGNNCQADSAVVPDSDFNVRHNLQDGDMPRLTDYIFSSDGSQGMSLIESHDFITQQTEHIRRMSKYHHLISSHLKKDITL